MTGTLGSPGPAGSSGATGRAPGTAGTSGAPVASCRACTRRFGDFVAVDHVDLAVGPGEVVGLLGANGAGKTTLIRLLLGLLHPSEGEVRLFGGPPSITTRGRLGYVPQSLGLYDDLTAAENLAFQRSVFGGGRGDGRGENGADLPDDLRPLADVPVGRLSLGLQRRLAFVAALGHRPDLLVLDEPTSGVGPLARARLWESIRSAADGGAGVLVTTHHMEEAEECDRLAVMAAGRLVAEGTVAEITGDATVTVVETAALAESLDALDRAGLRGVALVGRTLRVPGADPAAVEQALGPIDVRTHPAPATLEERFFELVAATPAR
jgi:ABC-2 type transport system ATP-binding protein